MQVSELATSVPVGLEEYYGASEALRGRAMPDSDGRAYGEPDAQGQVAEDTYAPSGRETGQAELESSRAVRGDAEDSVALRTCYCGVCSRCRMEESVRREAAGAEDEPRAGELSEGEQRQVEELRQRDAHVRAHEQAHAAAGATNVTYEYQIGPDGRAYAIGGSADISIHAPAGDPDGKIVQARRMRAAALAPADPSPEDAAIAARASQIEAEALAEKSEALRQEQEERRLQEDESDHPPHFFAIA